MNKDSTGTFGSMGIDTLTGLNDRSYLDIVNGTYISRKQDWSLLMLDVDHFKLINDIYGHLAGDKVLRQTALTIQINLRESDTAIRFGGDEFIIVLPDSVKDGALDLAQRLIYEINRISFSSGLHVSISIGVSRSRDTDKSITDIISRADKALYRAKESGRSKFYFFTENLTETDAPEISFSHLVGRRSEISKLRQLLEESVSDSSRFAIVFGEPGVGKTRLADELLNYCDFIKSVVIKNSVMEHTQYQSFSLLTDPIREVLSGLTDSEFNTVSKAVEPVHPATIELFPELHASLMDDTIYFREERLRFRIFRDISVLFAALSSIHPITLILDNLQWIAEPDLALLSFVARNTPDANILYLCIMRRDEGSEKIFEKLTSIKSSLPLLNLEISKMTSEEIRNMILFALKDPNVPREIQEFLIAQSGGNPLFLRELLTSIVDSGYISCNRSGEKEYNLPDDIDVPDSIGQIITMKLSIVSSEARKLLKIVSLSPDQFNLSLLERMTGRDKVELAGRLDECISAGIVEEVSDRSNRITFRFTHGAVRDYLSLDLPESLKVIYHQRMAAYFKGIYEKGRRELLTQVAYHYSRSEDSDNAAKYALLAAKQAFNTGANGDAIRWYTVYLERIPSDSERTGMFSVYINLGSLYSVTGEVEKADSYLKMSLELASSPKELAAVYLRLGRNNFNRSLYPEALENYGKAVIICREDNSGDTIVLRTLIETQLRTSIVHRLQGNFDKAFSCLDMAEKLLEENDAEIPEDIFAFYYTRKADVISELDSEDEAFELYEKALNIYKRIDDIPGQATVLNNMHGIYSRKGDYSRSLSTMDEVIRLNVKLDDKLGLAIGYYNIAEYYQEVNMLDLAMDYYDKYMEINDTINNELGIGYGRYGLGNLYWLKSDFRKSEFYFEGASEIFRKLQCDNMNKLCDLMIARICFQTNQHDRAVKLLESIDETHDLSIEQELLYVKGLLKLSRQDKDSLEQAVAQFRALIDSPIEHSEVNISMYYLALVSALRKLGRDEDIVVSLKEGSEILAKKLQHIKPYSIRNSMMNRRELSEFIDLCHDMGLPFPPDGFTFRTDQ